MTHDHLQAPGTDKATTPTRRRGILALAGLALVAFGAQSPMPASASSAGGLDYVSNKAIDSPPDSDPVIAPCPAGTQALGGGVSGGGGFNTQSLIGMQSFDAVDADSLPDDGWLGTLVNRTASTALAVRTQAICGTGQYQYSVGPVTNVPAGASAQVSAVCPGGHVASGGVSPVATVGRISVATSSPFDRRSDVNHVPDDGWIASVANHGAVAQEMQVTVICAKGRFSYPQREVTISSAQRSRVKVNCPRRAHVTGGGLNLASNLSTIALNGFKSLDLSDNDRAPDDAWRVTADNSDPGSRTATAYAVCKR